MLPNPKSEIQTDIWATAVQHENLPLTLWLHTPNFFLCDFGGNSGTKTDVSLLKPSWICITAVFEVKDV